MKRFQQNIRKVVPYVPGDQPDFPDMIKLNTNENPIRLHRQCRKFWHRARRNRCGSTPTPRHTS